MQCTAAVPCESFEILDKLHGERRAQLIGKETLFGLYLSELCGESRVQLIGKEMVYGLYLCQ